MKEYTPLGKKSKSYLVVYIVTLLICVAVSILLFIPAINSIQNDKVNVTYLVIAILFSIIDFILLYYLFNYLMKPEVLIEYNDQGIKIHKNKTKEIVINIHEIRDTSFMFTPLSIVLPTTGNVIIKTKDNKSYNVGYIVDYTSVERSIAAMKKVSEVIDNEKL